MINCSFKQLDAIKFKLQKILLTIKPKGIQLNESLKQTILSSITSYVDRLFEEIVIGREVVTTNYQEGQMYDQIEKDLQKQQNLNRLMIKKELEFKQYQKCLEEELKLERSAAKRLRSKIEKFNQKIINRDMQLLHLNNQKKIIGKQRKAKDFITMDTLLNDKIFNEGIKAFNKEVFPPSARPTHSRRRSDDIIKRPSTGSSKKKNSVNKK